MSGPDTKNGGRTLPRMDVQAKSEIGGFFATFFQATMVGLLAAIVLIMVLGAIFYPEGFWKFFRLWTGWLSYRLLPDFMGSRTSADARLWLRAWEGTSIIRMITGGVFFSTWALGGTGFWFYMRWRARVGAEGRGLREGENKLLTPEQLKSEIQRRVDRFRKDRTLVEDARYEYTPHDVVTSKSKVPVVDKVLSTSIGVAGVPGTGKTNTINEFLVQIHQAKDKAMVVDINGDFYASFGRPDDIVLSLTDLRASAWDFWSEGLDELTLASGLVELRDDMDEATKFYHSSGRSLLAALLRHSRSLPELWQLCMRSLAETRDFLVDKEDPIKGIFEGAGRDAKQISAIHRIATTGLQDFMPYFGHHAEERARMKGGASEPFSVRKWVLDDSDTRSIFLVARDQDWAMSKPFFQLISYIMGISLVERPQNLDRKIWYICDEVSTVGFVASLPIMLDRSRKHSGRVMLGFQTYSQLETIYGPTMAKSIFSGFGSLFVFRINDSELAKLLSAGFTSREVEQSKVSQSMSASGGPSVNTEIQDRPLVTASQFMTLPERTAYVRLSAFPPTKLFWQIGRYPTVNPDARAMGVRPERPWLKSIPITKYRKVRDQQRAAFLDELQASVVNFLRVYEDRPPGFEELLKAAVERCSKFLGTAAVARERIDHELYEIGLVKAKKTQTITVIRESQKVVVTVPLEQQEQPGQVPPDMPSPPDEGMMIPSDDELE